MPREAPSYASGGLRIDPVTPDQIPLFFELLGELVEVLDMTDVYTLTEEGLRAAMFQDPPRVEAIIVHFDDEPAGIATWSEYIHLVSGKMVMSFEYMYVRPQLRSHWITASMLIYLLLLAKQRDYFRVEGAVHEWNTETAEFYKRLGAERLPQHFYRFSMEDVDWTPFKSFIEDES